MGRGTETSTGAAVPLADVRWVRTRLRAAPGSALVTAALVLVTAFLAAALPRGLDSWRNGALRSALTAAPLAGRTITLASTLTPQMAAYRGDRAVGAGAVDAVERDFHRIIGPPLRFPAGSDQEAYGVRSAQPPPAADGWLPRPTPDTPPQADLFAQQGVSTHARLVRGAWPKPATAGGTAEAVVTERTAQVMGLQTGSAIHLADATGAPLTIRISGVVAPEAPGSPFWRSEASLAAPVLMSVPSAPGEPMKTYWQFGLLLDRGSAGLLPTLQGGAQLYWHRPVDVAEMTDSEVDPVLAELASLSGGPDAVRLQNATGDPGIQVQQQLDTLLDGYRSSRAAVDPLVRIAAVGAGAVAAIVLLMAQGLAAARRRNELALLRARGAGLAGLARRLAAESAAVAVPAAAAGTAPAVLAVPAGGLLPSLAAGCAVAAAASLVLPLRAAVQHRRPAAGSQDREDAAASRPSRRRTVFELTVLVLTAGAVAALRWQGSSGGFDPFLAAAPVLLAVAAALVLLRLYPLPLRLLARPAARLPGAVVHLAVARAGRSPAASRLPLAAVLVALTVASFGGSVLAGVAQGRDRAALAAVGADARVSGLGALPDGLAGRLRQQVGGVRYAVAVRTEPGRQIPLGSGTYVLVMVDPASYARLVHDTGLGAPFPAAALEHDPGTGPLPAVVSPGLAASFGSGPAQVAAQAGSVPVRVAGVAPDTPAAPGSDFAVVSLAGVARRDPAFAHSSFLKPTDLYLMGGRLDAGRLRAAVARYSPGASVALRSEQSAAYDTPLLSGAERLYMAAVAAGAGYGTIALLLMLAAGAGQRTAALAGLRTMGMTRRQSQAVLLLELVPQALAAAVGGALTGLIAVLVLGPAMDLDTLAFGQAASSLPPDVGGLVLRPDLPSLAVPSAVLPALAVAVLLGQVWWTRRRRESAQLRAGERT